MRRSFYLLGLMEAKREQAGPEHLSWQVELGKSSMPTLRKMSSLLLLSQKLAMHQCGPENYPPYQEKLLRRWGNLGGVSLK